MINFLICLIAITPLLQPTRSRAKVATVFAAALVGHDWLFGGASGDTYYLSAGICDAIVVFSVMSMAHTKLTKPIMWVSVVCLVCNFIGWLAWFNYLDTSYYQTAFIGIYAIAFYLLIRGSDAWGRCKTHNWLPRFSGLDTSYGCHGYKVSRKAGE